MDDTDEMDANGPYTASWGHTSFKPTRKRKRIVISCTECHRRKQKCDRAMPCSNCVFRNKVSACFYETEPSTKHRVTVAKRNASPDEGSRSPNSGNNGNVEHAKSERDSAESICALGYAKENNNNSLGIFKKIENEVSQTLPTVESISLPDLNGLRERYKSFVRQLPARNYVDMLVTTYFQEVNWHYSPIDEDYFMENFQNWNNISFSVLNRGPQALPADLRYFPALLFQVLALGLQFQRPNYDRSLDSLKYVSEMSLDDIANDYSESGLAILSLLGKKDITLATVQAGFLRTYFFKNAGLVTESWHSLSQTIRDAQEAGWHKDPINRTPESPEKALEALWLTEFRRRMWLVLVMWDAHMATMLGRPTNMDHSTLYNVTIPVDTPPSRDRRVCPPQPRSEHQPPTPVTMLLINVRFLHALWDIIALEKEGAHPKEFTKVEGAHQRIVESFDDMPPVFRAVNPDTRWDEISSCKWVTKGRQILKSTAGFCLMALHKPYAFTNARHRQESLKAALMILQAQRVLFANVEARHYKLFNLVISNFDAMVLLGGMYILHPTENRHLLNDALQHFDWAMERFEKMSIRNPMAKSALEVVQAIHVRLTKVLGKSSKKKLVNAAPLPAVQKSSTTSALPAVPAAVVPAASAAPALQEVPAASVASAASAASAALALPEVPTASVVPAVPVASTTSAPSAPSLVPVPLPSQRLASPDSNVSSDRQGSMPSVLRSMSDSVSTTSIPTSNASNFGSSDYSAVTENSSNNASSIAAPLVEQDSDWSAYQQPVPQGFDPNFDFSGIAPLHPMHDLLFNDLGRMPEEIAPTIAADPKAYYDTTGLWQFEGDFSDDSFWYIMNQYNL